MSTFDPDLFLNSETNDANDTTYTPIPVGENYQGAVDKVEPRTAGDKPVLEVTWGTTDPRAVEATGMERPTVRQTIWLDVNESGQLDTRKGKNVGLGRLRAALGQNVPGQPWRPGSMVGQVANLSISHRSGKQPGEVYAQVSAVSAL